jgi:hypothetical protein
MLEPRWKNYLHKKIKLKNFALKICFWKITFMKNCFTYKNVAFKIILGTWYKIDLWELSFSSRKKLWKWLYNKGHLNQNFDIRSFHI